MIIRRAAETDAGAATEVLRRSIVELCGADHRDDPSRIEPWLENKTADNMRSWIVHNHALVAVEGNQIVGVAAASEGGQVLLNYVAPSARFRGVSKALMAEIETWATKNGLTQLVLESTKTALPFYRSIGFVDAGEATCSTINECRCYPMRKSLSWSVSA